MVDVIKVIQDYVQEEGFGYWIDPEKGAWIEVHHPTGGARAHIDGRVESALNFKFKAVLEKKLALARTQEAEDTELRRYTSMEIYSQIKARLEDLLDEQLIKLADDIQKVLMDREGEHSADVMGGAL